MVQIESPVSVRLHLPDYDVHPVFHVSQLRPKNDSSLMTEEPTPQGEISDIHGEVEFPIEKIISHRWRGSRLWMRIKWRGYDKETEQRAETIFEDARSLLEDYIKQAEDPRLMEWLRAPYE